MDRTNSEALRQCMTIVPIVVVTTVLTNICLGNWDHPPKAPTENCPNIIVNVNGGKQLFSLMDLVDSVDSDISIQKITKDIYMMYVNTRYDIPTRYTEALVKAVDELQLLKMEISRTKCLYDSNSAESAATTAGLPTSHSLPGIATGKENYGETDAYNPKSRYQRAGKSTSEHYNPFYIYLRRKMRKPSNIIKGIKSDSSNLTGQVQKIQENGVHVDRRKSEKNSGSHLRKSTLDRTTDTTFLDFCSKLMPNEEWEQSYITFLDFCSKLMPHEEWEQYVRIHWNKVALIMLTIFCFEVYAWLRFIVYSLKMMTKLVLRICHKVRYFVFPVKAKHQNRNGNMNIVVPTNIPKGKITVPRVSIVVITFGNGVAAKHLEIAESLIGHEKERKYPIKTLTIKKAKDLDNLPRSKIALIFVDFNESNTILEEPDQKKQLKSLTVKNILDTKEMEAIIIYCYDSASAKLDWGQLYAPKLISVTTHPLLKELEKNKCVLSIDKDLSEFQKAHLKQKLEKLLPT